MGFQPVSSKDDIVGAYVRDIEFGTFLMIVVVRSLDTDSVTCGLRVSREQLFHWVLLMT
jgi:hypothetical protein